MKAKRFMAVALALVFVFAGSAFSAQPEDALSSRTEDSVYAVLKLDDTSALLKWIFSEGNINTFMPLILASENSNEIIGGIEMINAIIQNTPLKSVALIAGVTGKNPKSEEPFFQMAFTVSPELNSVVRNISKGKAEAKDIAKLILGTNNPLSSLAETMIKVERINDNIFRVDNAVFMKAVDDLVILGLSENDIKDSLNALDDKSSRLSALSSRRFRTNDFAFLHVDQKTMEAIDDTGDLKDVNVDKYFDKPITMEFGFEKFADKFIFSSHGNFKEAMTKAYAERFKDMRPVKGGHIDLRNSGAASIPIFAMGGILDISGANEIEEAKPYLDELFGQLRKRFGVEKEDVLALLNGPFSMVVNGSVMFESFKIPALYISQTGAKGAASRVYTALMRSRHFHEVHDGILQVDSSLSPVSCIIGNAGNTLGIAFAELASFKDRPASEGAFGELMSKEAIASFWIDFTGIQSWLNDDSNGIFSTLAPVAAFMGYGKILESVRDVLGADFSVTSMSLYAEDVETFHMEFALKDVRAEDGLFSKLIKLYREFK